MSQKLFDFIIRAGQATYAGGGKREKNPEREGFIELVYSEGKFEYRDSYTGFYRSRGMELVRKNGQPIWSSLYGGGMMPGKEDLAEQTFVFLKKAMSAKEDGFKSFRGPHDFLKGDWRYAYEQQGDVDEFNGYEEIYFQGELVFFHRIIGGMIKHKK